MTPSKTNFTSRSAAETASHPNLSIAGIRSRGPVPPPQNPPRPVAGNQPKTLVQLSALRFLCLTHNLTVLHDQTLADAGIQNTAEVKRRAKHLATLTVSAAAAGRIIPCIIAGFQRLTRRSVKFIRWLRQNLWSQRPLPDPCAILKLLYRTS